MMNANNMIFDYTEHPHRRYNPLGDKWILVSPHRAKRPWQGKVETEEKIQLSSYDKTCYLCPKNLRINGVTNPNYTGTYVFENDFAAIKPDSPSPGAQDDSFFVAAQVQGVSRVICYSPDHSKSIAELPKSAIKEIVNTWCEQMAELGKTYANVQIFENKGAMMGCSSPHPHGQIWATSHIPTIVSTENQTQKDWFDSKNNVMLLTLAEREVAGDRSVTCNKDWLVIVPYWAEWPFETLLLPRFPILRLSQLSESQRDSLAEIMKDIVARYDNLFNCTFPYTMGWHSAPFIEGSMSHWQLHAHFYPPLLRSSTIRKFMVGFELLAEIQRDITPEQAAERLRVSGGAQ